MRKKKKQRHKNPAESRVNSLVCEKSEAAKRGPHVPAYSAPLAQPICCRRGSARRARRCGERWGNGGRCALGAASAAAGGAAGGAASRLRCGSPSARPAPPPGTLARAPPLGLRKAEPARRRAPGDRLEGRAPPPRKNGLAISRARKPGAIQRRKPGGGKSGADEQESLEKNNP